MPIRPENKDRYPANWASEVRPAILERAKGDLGWPRCEECLVPNHSIGYRDSKDVWQIEMPGELGGKVLDAYGVSCKVVEIVLTIAHLNHQPEDCRPENLRAWCQRCHNRYDMPMRRAGIKERARAQRADGDLFERAT